MSWPRLTRRRFLQFSAGAAMSTAAGVAAYSQVQQGFRLGLIGAGARGKQLASLVRWMRPCPLYGEIVAVCDVHRLRSEELKQQYCPAADLYGHHARLLERDDIAAVIIATPDHWHTALALAALKAGKAVYCEKPLTLTVAEGQTLVQAAKQTGQTFQVGTQQRSDWRFQTACALVRNGRLGQLERITVSLPIGSLPPTNSGGPFDDESAPDFLDWNQWLGQAPLAPFCKQRFDPFRWWFDYSGGFMTDWGAHHIDIAHWAMGCEHSGPTTVESQALLPAIPNGYTTPRDFTVDMTYPSGVKLHVELSAKVNGIRFEGDRGTLFVNRKKITGSAYDELANRPLANDAVRFGKPSYLPATANCLHMLDFFHCIGTGEQPISDVASQHRSATACHLANISMRLGRKLKWDPTRELIVNDPEAGAMLARTQRDGYQFNLG